MLTALRARAEKMAKDLKENISKGVWVEGSGRVRLLVLTEGHCVDELLPHINTVFYTVKYTP